MQWATQQDWLLGLCGQCKLKTCPVQKLWRISRWQQQRCEPSAGLLSTDPTHLQGLAPVETVLAGARLPWLLTDSAALSKALEPSESLSDFSSIKWRPFLPHIVGRTKSDDGWRSPGLIGSTFSGSQSCLCSRTTWEPVKMQGKNADASSSARFRPRSSSQYY